MVISFYTQLRDASQRLGSSYFFMVKFNLRWQQPRQIEIHYQFPIISSTEIFNEKEEKFQNGQNRIDKAGTLFNQFSIEINLDISSRRNSPDPSMRSNCSLSVSIIFHSQNSYRTSFVIWSWSIRRENSAWWCNLLFLSELVRKWEWATFA